MGSNNRTRTLPHNVPHPTNTTHAHGRDIVADFTHLHVHSEYSLLDGQSRIKRLVAAAQAGGMNALALTDHGAMYGIVEFYKACKAAGVKPIIGVEGYTVPSLEEKT